MNIPPGYRVTITSWENDADNYADEVFSGLTEADVYFLIELAELFRRAEAGGFGGRQVNNETASPAKIAIAVDLVIDKHPNISAQLQEQFQKMDGDGDGDELFLADHYLSLAADLIGSPGDGFGYGYLRVMDGYVVHHFKEEVLDCTAKFDV